MLDPVSTKTIDQEAAVWHAVLQMTRLMLRRRRMSPHSPITTNTLCLTFHGNVT
ncbi:hypothetical protein Hanom_Chr16g01449581 [Helianthus anomalus]